MSYRILVTGASGFVGSALVPALVAAGHRVRAVSRRKAVIPLCPGVEWRDSVDLSKDVDWRPLLADIDFVVHLAGIAHRGAGNDAVYDAVNHRATRQLAVAAQRNRIRRLVFLSSIGAQSGSAADHVVRESDNPRPVTAYDRAKLEAEAAIRETGVPHIILRPVVIYGPNPKGNIALLMRLAALPLPLPFGGFQNRRSLISMDNLLDAIELSLDSASALNRTFIVADREPITLVEMFAALRSGIGRRADLISVPPIIIERALKMLGGNALWDRIGRELVASSELLQQAGWRPRVSTPDGLRSLMAPQYRCGAS